ncbi:MAG: acyl-CoA desaturase, partial [Microbacteriaceae bacterium]|nr:acyl-CoA desaturase [Microbacteriaceae bacterium]
MSRSDRHPPPAHPGRHPAAARPTNGVFISASLAGLSGTLGPLRQTYARTDDFPSVARAYTQLSQVIRESGLLRRTPWFYGLVGAALVVGFAGAATGLV